MTGRGPERARTRGAGEAGSSMLAAGRTARRLLRGWRVVLLAAIPVAATAARAQTPNANGNRLLVSAGISDAVQRDQRVSPLSYSGVGPIVDLAFTHRSDRALLEVGVAGTSFRATSRITRETLPYEHDLTGRMRLAYYRRIAGGAHQRTTWLVGGVVHVEATGNSHHYADLNQQTGSYGFGLASLAPALLWEARLAHGRAISARVSVPVFAVVSRPYFNRGFDIDVPLRAVTIGALRAARGSLQYAQPIGERVGVVVAYRLSALAYRDAPSYRRLSQALTLSLSLRLGRSSQ